jgi:hypothetical protein
MATTASTFMGSMGMGSLYIRPVAMFARPIMKRSPAGLRPQTAIYPMASGKSVPKSPIEPANSLRLNSNDLMFINYWE